MKKKSLLVCLSFVIISGAALTGFCGDSKKKKDTPNATNVQAYDPNALACCNGIGGAKDRIRCLSSIKGQTYNPNAVASCRGISGANDRIWCLESINGQAHSRGGRAWEGPTDGQNHSKADRSQEGSKDREEEGDKD